MRYEGLCSKAHRGKYAECKHVVVAGTRSRLLGEDELNEFTQHIAGVMQARVKGKPIPQRVPPKPKPGKKHVTPEMIEKIASDPRPSRFVAAALGLARLTVDRIRRANGFAHIKAEM